MRSLQVAILALVGALWCTMPCIATQANHNKHQVPGLYEATNLLTPIQGEKQFQELVSPGTFYSYDSLAQQRVSMIQFYMATCPHCQGFSAYFKRLVEDIGPHWHRLMHTYVVNCNDELNVNVCWTESSDPYVPAVRWSSVPLLLENVNTTNQKLLEDRNLSWTHRKKVVKSRRDLLSLRHATLDFMRKQVDLLRVSTLEQLPLKWLVLEPLKSIEMLAERSQQCMNLWRSKLKNPIVDNYVVYNNNSYANDDHYVARTIVADWSNFTCTLNAKSSSPNRLMMVHYADSSSLLPELRDDSTWISLLSYGADQLLKPVFLLDKQMLFSSSDKQALKLPSSDPERTTNPLLMEEFGFTSTMANKQQQSAAGQPVQSTRRRRDVSTSTRSLTRRRREAVSLADQLNYEDVNWVPPQLYPGEEHLRWQLNKVVRESVVSLYGLEMAAIIPLVGHQRGNPGEIVAAVRRVDPNSIISPKEDDLTPVRLTDFYKVLGQIVHGNMIFTKQLDGYKLLGSSCFLEQLTKHFPFQGGRVQNHRSVSRTFVKLLEQDELGIVSKQLSKLMVDQPTADNNNDANSTIAIHDCSSHKQFLIDEPIKQALNSVNVLSSRLLDDQRKINEQYDVGLPEEGHFSWAYCKGSKDYLRGQTCALWIMFHTLTVHEYLEATQNRTLEPTATDESIYEFKINYEKNRDRAKCDPKNPEPAFLNATSSELFVDAPQYALANVINFVRYYLACTNCAAHFSCMVKSSDIDFEDPEPGDHLLWVWEAHNRVNLRTKNTHSEDPTRPKHIFPNYEACPECYVKKPDDPITAGGKLDSVQFYRQPVIDFLVSRYRPQAILNNKMRIEDLWKKPVSKKN